VNVIRLRDPVRVAEEEVEVEEVEEVDDVEDVVEDVVEVDVEA